jgi:hypothetical protein
VAWDEAEIDEWIKSRSKEFGPAPARSNKEIEAKTAARG